MIYLRIAAVFIAGAALWTVLVLYAVACGSRSRTDERWERVTAYADQWGQRAADWVGES